MRNEHELIRLAEQLEQDEFETLGLEFDMDVWQKGNSYSPISFHITFNETNLKITEKNNYGDFWNKTFLSLCTYYDIDIYDMCRMFDSNYYMTSTITPVMVATRIRKVVHEYQRPRDKALGFPLENFY